MAVKTNFTDCDLTGAILKNGNFKGADFTGAKLENVVWSGADIDEATFDENVKEKIGKLI